MKKLASITEGDSGTFRIEGLEMMRVGTWYPATGGELDISRSDLDEMVSTFKAIGSELQPGLKLGHVDSIDGGLEAPRFGSLVDVWREGDVLLGTIDKVPKGIAVPIQNGAWPRVSLELWQKFKNSAGKAYKWAIDAVAFLGNSLPAVSTLADVNGLYGMEHAPVMAAAEPRGEGQKIVLQRSAGQHLVRLGILIDRVSGENKAAALDEISYRGSDLVWKVLRGEDEYAEMDMQARRNAADEIMEDMQELWAEPELLHAFSMSPSTVQPSRVGTEQEETAMSAVDKDELSRLTSERDELKMKLQEKETDATKAQTELQKLQHERRSETAKASVAAFFDGLGGRVLPAEREAIEPAMVALMAAEDDATVRFSAKDGEDVTVADALKSMFEARRGVPEDLFKALLKAPDPNQKVQTAQERVTELASKIEREEKVDFASALKRVRQEEPDLYADMERERAESVPTTGPRK